MNNCVQFENRVSEMSQNINTVDVIFPAWPVLLYANPILGKHLLEVLFRYQATGQYPNAWSVHDIGRGCFLFRTFAIYKAASQVRLIQKHLGIMTGATNPCLWKVGLSSPYF